MFNFICIPFFFFYSEIGSFSNGTMYMFLMFVIMKGKLKEYFRLLLES